MGWASWCTATGIQRGILGRGGCKNGTLKEFVHVRISPLGFPGLLDLVIYLVSIGINLLRLLSTFSIGLRFCSLHS